MRFSAIFFSLALVFFPIALASAQDQPASTAPQQQSLDAGQLDQLVAPIALYPDPLLAQVLMASTYPLEMVQADRWAKANKSLKGDKLNGRAGEAGLGREREAASIDADRSRDDERQARLDPSTWRRHAGATGRCNGCHSATARQGPSQWQARDDQAAEGDGQAGRGRAPIIDIEPASPDIVYVPYYEPAVVYGTWDYPELSALLFPAARWLGGWRRDRHRHCLGRGLAIGHDIWDGFDWRSRQYRRRHR